MQEEQTDVIPSRFAASKRNQTRKSKDFLSPSEDVQKNNQGKPIIQKIKRSRMSPLAKSPSAIVTIFDANQSEMAQNYMQIQDYLTLGSSTVGSLVDVIELSAQKFKIDKALLQQHSASLNPSLRVQSLLILMKIAKDCLIEIEVSNNVHHNQRKRIQLTTHSFKTPAKNNQQVKAAMDAIDSSTQSVSELPNQLTDPQQEQINGKLVKVFLNPTSVRNNWHNIVVDFDKHLPVDAAGQKLKINSITIQAPHS